ncbi:hypothetical protein TrispH2_006604 [Trichoplax sp. H2]|nr:hypothetical protein TrispH2_006604 [Trichoplax sp. H2]|eukprot:RDD42725.1 hypothetical protein TrispH2_006604 [Trichoplax sp. H2]
MSILVSVRGSSLDDHSNATVMNFSSTTLLFRGLAYLILVIATVIGNCVVFYVFHKHHELLLIPSNLFILNLLITDVLNGLFKNSCNSMNWFNNGWLLGIAICRYLVIVHSYGKPLKFSCLLDWLSVSGASYVLFALIVDTIIPFMLLELCYIVIYIVIARNAKRILNRFHSEHLNNTIGISVNNSVASTPEMMHKHGRNAKRKRMPKYAVVVALAQHLTKSAPAVDRQN